MFRAAIITFVLLGLILGLTAGYCDLVSSPLPPLSATEIASRDFWLGLTVPDIVVGAGAVLLVLEAMFFVGLVFTRKKNTDDANIQ